MSKSLKNLGVSIIALAVFLVFSGCFGGSNIQLSLKEDVAPVRVQYQYGSGSGGSGGGGSGGGSASNTRNTDASTPASTPAAAPAAQRTPSGSVNLVLDAAPVTVYVTQGSPVQVSFTAPADGRYRFWSSANSMNVVAFSDATLSGILADCDSGEDRNFSFERSLMAGQTFTFFAAYRRNCGSHFRDGIGNAAGNFDLVVRKVN